MAGHFNDFNYFYLLSAFKQAWTFKVKLAYTNLCERPKDVKEKTLVISRLTIDR